MRLAIVLLLGSAATARADQCQWLDDASVVQAAKHQLELHSRYIAYCAPCGDKAPGEPQTAHAVTASAHDVTIDGHAIDLAYTYVQVADTAYANLAALAGCPTSGVAPSLRVDPATASGVMIRPSDEAIAAPQPAVEVAPEPPPQAAAADPPEVVYVVHESGTPAWIIALLAGAGTSGAWASIALARRRRRAFKPRAIELE